MYEFKLLDVIRVVDGDTIDCRISLGFGLNAAFRFRLAGIDTPEVYGKNASAEGQAAKEFTEAWLKEHEGIVVRTFKGSESTVGIGDGAFGRWLAAFFDADGFDLASALAEQGLVAFSHE